MQVLTARQEQILGTVAREYIGSAKPVGSDTIANVCCLGISPATIRNELAELTDLGYITQPHTSAGRVPTTKGYRYFVERLMEEAELPLSQQLLIRHQFHQISLDLDQWMKLAATVLASISQSASLITAPQARQIRFRHVEMISISDMTGLMIIVLQDSTVHQQMMVFGGPTTQEDLSRISNKLNAELSRLSTEQARAKALSNVDEQDPFEVSIVRQIVSLLEAHEASSGREVRRDGLAHILRQPEFVGMERARQIVEILEQDVSLEAIINETQRGAGVQVIIGNESRWEEIRDCSMVMSGYGLPGEADGVLGVVGPMRMSYERAVPAVRYVARLMSDLVHRLYGE
jgi:heat-inducible transcriptional repressor